MQLMNKNKISPDILNSVSVLNKTNKTSVIVSANNFNVTKNFLNEFKFNYTPYRFASCFCVDADFDDINILSCQTEVDYIFSNPEVKINRIEHDFMNLEHLTEGKFYGQGQTICFIDTGLHPHFDFIFPHNRVIKFIDLINKNNIPYDDNGHGTFVTGIACGGGIFKGEFKGFAPLCNIISIKALGEKGNSNSNTILDAMQWVYENYKAYNISVVCMSFGADVLLENDPLSKGAESLWKKGITVVAAAGNSGPENNTIKSPGNSPYIITVGALDVKSMEVPDFSSRGPTIYGNKPDLIAPAVDIIACNNEKDPYTTMSGTSVATPIVAGICAIIKCRNPKITNTEIKQFLLSNCHTLTGDPTIEGAGYLKF